MQGGIDSFYNDYVPGTIFISDNLDVIWCDQNHKVYKFNN